MGALKKRWRVMANEVGGEYIRTGIFRKPKIKIIYKNQEIIINPYSKETKIKHEYTILKSQIYSRYGFKFEITVKKALQKFLERVGSIASNKLVPITTGCVEFDDQFKVKTNNPSITNIILSNDEIRKMMYMINKLKVTIEKGKKKIDKHSDFLIMEIPGYVTNSLQLKDIIDLYKLFIDELINNQAIEENNLVKKRL
ncbi:hypothetical protein [Oceanirhabdus seepicola]|uniref:Uncharacterized protein n=1 Tax=Oceanirhabdus seepicola TaxID=2828781 RepID=A0A9J6NXA5_9CLOT|nr:hypothetical protein [Oceanirhabdus seepicola]MCM1988630.1 hypothetical protein [Oceanirhabdus seepicola]